MKNPAWPLLLRRKKLVAAAWAEKQAGGALEQEAVKWSGKLLAAQGGSQNLGSGNQSDLQWMAGGLQSVGSQKAGHS